MTTIGIIHSQQPHNQYAGEGTGPADSEQKHMRDLCKKIVAKARAAGLDVLEGPTGNASSTYATNVSWANNQPLDALISLHSNATARDGDNPTGTGAYYVSAAGKRIASAIAEHLDGIVPGKAYISDSLTVAELTRTKAPAVLVENEYHDWPGTPDAGGAAWLRDPDNQDKLAAAYVAAFLTLWKPSTKAPQPEAAATSDIPAFPLPPGYYFGPKRGPARSVSGYYPRRFKGRTCRNLLRIWQRQAAKIGAYTGRVDGLYGPLTAQAALTIQAAAGIAQDKLIGAATWPAAWTVTL